MKQSDVSLGACARDSLVDDEDVKEPIEQTKKDPFIRAIGTGVATVQCSSGRAD